MYTLLLATKGRGDHALLSPLNILKGNSIQWLSNSRSSHMEEFACMIEVKNNIDLKVEIVRLYPKGTRESKEIASLNIGFLKVEIKL